MLHPPDQTKKGLLALWTLQEGLSSAQHHITIASLYIGTEGAREEQFVAALAAAAQDASRPQLEIDVLLDALRSTRPTKGTDGELRSQSCQACQFM